MALVTWDKMHPRLQTDSPYTMLSQIVDNFQKKASKYVKIFIYTLLILEKNIFSF